MRFTHKCPKCGTKLITEMGIDEFPVAEYTGSDEVHFDLPGRGYKDNNGKFHKSGSIRIPNGLDREIFVPAVMTNKAVALTKLLTRIMTLDDGTPVFQENVKAMSVRDRDYLENLIDEISYGIDMSFTDVVCSGCGADLSQERAESDFF